MEESIYYNRLINMLFNTCSEVLRAVLPVLIQGEEKYKSMSVNEFVKSNEEDIMKKKIGAKYTQKLFPTRNRKTNIQNWDITLLCFIACDILQPDWKVKANIDMLRDIRNELCHVSDTNITRRKYEKHLKIIQDINDVFLGLVNDGNLTKKIADKTEDITNGSPDIDKAFDVLLNWFEIEKKPLEEKCTLTADKKKTLDYLRTLVKSMPGKAAVDQFRMKWESESKDGKSVTIKEGKPFLRDAFKYILEVDASSRLRVIIDEGQGPSSKGPDVKKFFKRIFDKSLRHRLDMFSGLDRDMCCVPSDSPEAGSQKWFFALGKAIVLSQVHGGPIFQHLAEYVVQYVCGGDYEKHLNLVLVSDMDLVKLIHKMGRCTTQVDFKVCFKEVQEDYLQNSNWTEDILIEHCEKMTRHLLKWYLVDKRKEALEQLKKGLNTLSFLDHMRPTPRALDILRYQRYGKVTARKFRESIEKSLKAMTVESETQEVARLSMLMFMDQMTDEDASMFSKFISGAEGQPVLRSHIDTQFNTADISQTALLAEPVKHKLIIPLGNKMYKEFFSSIRKAILTPPETP